MTDQHSERLIGHSKIIRQVDRQVDEAARSEAKVLITGESGAGKEVVARLIHERSRRAAARLLTLNWAGVPDSLLESELFGHVRGPFTGAYRDKLGLLELAHRGTIFMDEVGEMSLRMQSLLLRFLETGEIHRVGADVVQTRVDVRVMAATNRNLKERIDANEFREDLFYRLNVIHLHVPPLRERREDIPEMLEHFLTRYAGGHSSAGTRLEADALDRLIQYDWPGNVRELKNIVERVLVRRHDGAITTGDLPAEVLGISP
ncbi:MAG: sigma-54-dependent Fis family transcriptional regulator, partial [Acidobacteria bacterium]